MTLLYLTSGIFDLSVTGIAPRSETDKGVAKPFTLIRKCMFSYNHTDDKSNKPGIGLVIN